MHKCAITKSAEMALPQDSLIEEEDCFEVLSFQKPEWAVVRRVDSASQKQKKFQRHLELYSALSHQPRANLVLAEHNYLYSSMISVKYHEAGFSLLHVFMASVLLNAACERYEGRLPPRTTNTNHIQLRQW